MRLLALLAAALLALTWGTSDASAKRYHRHKCKSSTEFCYKQLTKRKKHLHRKRYRKHRYHRRKHKIYRAYRTHRGLVTVTTAAGIKITVAPSFVPKIQAFIADLVKIGYRPRSIHCYARGGHVPRSMHYSGQACDIDQRGWNRTASTMYRIGYLARRHALRDGCSFRDCGHIDAGRTVQIARRHYRTHQAHRQHHYKPRLRYARVRWVTSYRQW